MNHGQMVEYGNTKQLGEFSKVTKLNSAVVGRREYTLNHHTPGKWFAVRNPGASPMYPTLGWEILCDSPELHSRGYSGPSVLMRTTDFDSQANAQRVAACVNACQNYSTARLVEYSDLPSEARDAIRLQAEIAKLRADNERMRAALTMLADDEYPHDAYNNHNWAIKALADARRALKGE